MPKFPIPDDSVTAEIAQSFSKFLVNSTYACGGTVRIRQPDVVPSLVSSDTTTTDTNTSLEHVLTDPVVIRWDATTSIEKLILPLPLDESHEGRDSVEKLVIGTQPASFGFQGQDIIDESYRKALKLDTSAFSTNFCPYEAGIIDVIGQALLPKLPAASQGIRAELYKLNVSSFPNSYNVLVC